MPYLFSVEYLPIPVSRHFRVAVLLCALKLLGLPPAAFSLGETPAQLESLLSTLRPDSRLYIGEIRQVPRLHLPPTHYMALVRPGGVDPLDPADAPLASRDKRNDILFYSDSIGLERSPAWRLLLLDHEYLHAKHLAGALFLPLVSFGSRSVDRHFFEAAAWGINLSEASRGTYGPLSDRERAEIRGHLLRHMGALRRFIHRRQPSAWLYYSRFFPSLDPTGGPDPVRNAPRGPGGSPPPQAAGGSWPETP